MALMLGRVSWHEESVGPSSLLYLVSVLRLGFSTVQENYFHGKLFSRDKNVFRPAIPTYSTTSKMAKCPQPLNKTQTLC